MPALCILKTERTFTLFPPFGEGVFVSSMRTHTEKEFLDKAQLYCSNDLQEKKWRSAGGLCICEPWVPVKLRVLSRAAQG